MDQEPIEESCKGCAAVTHTFAETQELYDAHTLIEAKSPNASTKAVGYRGQ
jgi:hypothetical protein